MTLPFSARTRAVSRLELASTLKRPLFWSLVIILFLLTWGLSKGNVHISSGDASVGGTKAWITSEYSVSFILSIMTAALYSFFIAIAAGLIVVRDDEEKIGELLHTTPLRTGEYIWGKFLAVVTGFAVVLAIHLLLMIFFNHVIPNANAADVRGPLQALNYLRPALVFALPALLFFGGVAFYLGERWRRPLAVFLFPTAVLLLSVFFLWDWAPTWLDPRINRVLMLLDPAGFRWLNETWLKLDRGARFYNTARVGLDLPFLLSRLAFCALGLLGVAGAERHFARTLRGKRGDQPAAGAPQALTAPAAEPREATRPLAALGMRSAPPGFAGATWLAARTELRNLLFAPGLYLFAVLILLDTLSESLVALGAFQTELLLTPGLLAVRSMNALSLLLCLLLMFYTVESLQRERDTGLAAIAYAAPVPTGALLLGKAFANSAIGVLMAAATFFGCAIALLIEGKMAPNPLPFLAVWGLLLVPTLLLWTSFITAVQAFFGQRYATYGLGLSVLGYTLYRVESGGMNWTGNWILWDALHWSDISHFELDRRALVLNRLFALALAALLTAIAGRAFARRQADATGTLNRLAPGPLGRQALRFAPVIALPLVLGVMLSSTVRAGFEGATVKKKAHDYWKQNLATWLDAPQPSLATVDLDLRFAPERRWFHNHGTYELFNDRDQALSRFALTGGAHWTDVHWTLDGKPWQPENRSGLYIFTPPTPLLPGGHLRIGFDFAGTFPQGVTENGGTTMEFILPSGVVLTSFRPSFTPVIGFLKDIGIEKDKNDYEPRDYPPDFYVGRTDTMAGLNRSFQTRIRITGPADFTWNSVGVKTAETVAGGLRTVIWQSDHPVRIFNVVAGRWRQKQGAGTTIYYDPRHAWNIDEMSATFDASRRWYSEWFHPYPWRELKLSEFPGLASYAQGFPTDITFSENIGFLTKSDAKIDAVFLVTAHETAHQWWGNLLTPGEGPGGDLLSEGMSHFSMLLLMEKVKGEQARMETAKRLEEKYGDDRLVDAERPLVRVDGSHDGDTTVTYDKGGWVFWMLQRHMGRDRALAGLRQFINDWSDNPDHPVLQDFIAAMRPFAPDAAAYDDFVRQWFLEVVVPEYRLSDGHKSRSGSGWEAVVKVRNAGTGRMPVDVAATRGERFTENGKPEPGWQQARSTVLLGPGEEREVRIACPFEPDKIVVDPDVQVLQLRRKAVVQSLK